MEFNSIEGVEAESVVRALAALAQETRLRVFRLLVQTGPEGLAAGRIAAALGLADATLSFHLKEMSKLLPLLQEMPFPAQQPSPPSKSWKLQGSTNTSLTLAIPLEKKSIRQHSNWA